MVVIKLLRPIVHDGKTIKTGEIIEFEKQQAIRLIKIGTAELMESDVGDYHVEIPIETTGPRYGELDTSEDFDELIAKANRMTNEQLRRELAGLGVPYRPADNKVTLIALYTRAVMEA